MEREGMKEPQKGSCFVWQRPLVVEGGGAIKKAFEISKNVLGIKHFVSLTYRTGLCTCVCECVCVC